MRVQSKTDGEFILDYLFAYRTTDIYRNCKRRGLSDKEYHNEIRDKKRFFINARNEILKIRKNPNDGYTAKWRNYCKALVDLFKEEAFKDHLVIDFIKLLRNTAEDNTWKEENRKLANRELKKILKSLYPDGRGRNTRVKDVVSLALEYDKEFKRLQGINKNYKSEGNIKLILRGKYKFLNNSELEELVCMKNSTREKALFVVGRRNNCSKRLKDWINEGKNLIKIHKYHIKEVKDNPIYSAIASNVIS